MRSTQRRRGPRRPAAPKGADSGLRRGFLDERAAESIRMGRIGALLSLVALSAFAVLDYKAFNLHVLHWRVLGIASMALFAAATYAGAFRGRPRLTIYGLATALLLFMVHIACIVLEIMYAPSSSPFLTYLVLDSLVVSMIGVYLFAAGARRLLPAILFGPLVAVAAHLVISRPRPLVELSVLSNPAAVALCLSFIALLQDRLAFKEYSMRRLAEARGEEKRQAEERTRENQRMLQAFLDALDDRAFVVDRTGLVLFANEAFSAGVGAGAAGAVGRRLADLAPAFSKEQREAALQLVLAKREAVKIETEEGGAVFEQSIYPVFDARGEIVYLGCIGKDVTERVSRARSLEFAAVHDALTGLYNRRFLLERVAKAAAMARRGKPGAILYMDLDGFKPVNDRAGHDAGDRVLKDVAGILVGSVRDGDGAFRVGGDEFALVLEDIGRAGALRIAERLRATVGGRDFVFGGEAFRVGLSVGVALVDGEDGPEAVLARADAAMYRAKRGGKDRVEYLARG